MAYIENETRLGACCRQNVASGFQHGGCFACEEQRIQIALKRYLGAQGVVGPCDIRFRGERKGVGSLLRILDKLFQL